MNEHGLEFVFASGHVEVYKEKQHEAYYWKLFDENHLHGAFMNIQACIFNYENALISEAEYKSNITVNQQMPKTPCPVIVTNQPNNNVIFVDFFAKKRAF